VNYSKIRRWASSVSANVAALFALSLMPVLAVSGFAIDAHRQVNIKKHLQAANDVAVLAGARAYKNEFDFNAAFAGAAFAFNANIENVHGDVQCVLNSVNPDPDNMSIWVDSFCEIPTIFGVGISGKAKMKVNAISEAAAVRRVADVVMILDLSGSMDPTELGYLKTAAKRAAELAIGPQAG